MSVPTDTVATALHDKYNLMSNELMSIPALYCGLHVCIGFDILTAVVMKNPIL
jgi:hypothetical protein